MADTIKINQLEINIQEIGKVTIKEIEIELVDYSSDIKTIVEDFLHKDVN